MQPARSGPGMSAMCRLRLRSGSRAGLDSVSGVQHNATDRGASLMIQRYGLVAAIFLGCGGVTLAGGYPRGDVLIEAEDLEKQDVVGRVRLLDTRPQAVYRNQHFPGAVWVDHASWTKAFAHGQDAAGWQKRIGALGIDMYTPVVVHDAGAAKEAADIRLILRYWGIHNVRVLNGGFEAFERRGNRLTRDELKIVPCQP